jgi:hypothetical protein
MRRAFPYLEAIMADFSTRFSCVLDVGTPDNAARALKLYQAFMEDAAHEEVPPDGFLLSIEPEHGATRLWIRDTDGWRAPSQIRAPSDGAAEHPMRRVRAPVKRARGLAGRA